MVFDYEFRMRIDAPRPTVFEKLLRIEHLSRWFCGWSRIEPKVGGSFKFGGETCIILPEGRGWETKIDQGEVLRRFAFSWPIQSRETRVSYELDDGAGGVTLFHASHRGVPIRDSTCGRMQDAWRMCLGNLKSVAEGRGDSVRPDHSPATSADLKLSVLIEAAPSKVFPAFEDSESVGHWASGGVPREESRVDARVGGAFSLGTGDGPDRIADWLPGRRIGLAWSKHEERSLRFDFEEKASGTAVYLTESRFDYPGDAAIALRERGRWSDRLVSLKNFVESGSSGFTNVYEDQVRET